MTTLKATLHKGLLASLIVRPAPPSKMWQCRRNGARGPRQCLSSIVCEASRVPGRVYRSKHRYGLSARV